MKTIVIPNDPALEIEIPADYPIPPEGSDFYLNYEHFVAPEDWPSVRSILEDNVLTVEQIDGDKVFLQEGGGTEYAEDYNSIFADYWEVNPSTRPPGF
jgi:hypothetical protein